jgi:hypothetical protein
MADTKALEELNREIVRLVDELSAMNAKQERLRDLMRQRGELEQQLLGSTADPTPRLAARRRATADRADESTAVAAS